MCSTETPILFIAGFLLLGCCHSVIANRLAHLAAHNSLFETKWPNRIARWLSIEMYGFFSERVAYEIHISQHHPYTNIICECDYTVPTILCVRLYSTHNSMRVAIQYPQFSACDYTVPTIPCVWLCSTHNSLRVAMQYPQFHACGYTVPTIPFLWNYLPTIPFV